MMVLNCKFEVGLGNLARSCLKIKLKDDRNVVKHVCEVLDSISSFRKSYNKNLRIQKIPGQEAEYKYPHKFMKTSLNREEGKSSLNNLGKQWSLQN